jgi:dsRNA-specific ribonuclease
LRETGEGSSRRRAEQAAAQRTLDVLTERENGR